MRILQVVPELNIGGVETGTVDMARALIQAGHEAYVVSAGGRLVADLVKMGAHHITLPVNEKTPVALGTIRPLRRLIERERIDIVHARSRVPAWVAYFASRSTQARFVTTCHGHYANHFFSKPMGWGKRVIVVSHAIGRYMIEDFHVPPERIRLIHRGVDLSHFTFRPDKYDRPKSSPERWIIGYVGRLSPVKGCEYLIKAVHLLIRRIRNVELWIIGSPSPGKVKYQRVLEELVQRFGMKDHVRFLGQRGDVPELLEKIDVLVLPSVIPEGIGRVLLEAGAVGTAVVATKVGGLLDVIDHGKTGFFVEPHDPEGLSEAIRQLLVQPQLAKQFSHALNQKVREYFSLDDMVSRTLQVYEEVLEERRILVVKLSALGDLLLITPSLRMLRKRFPKSVITVLVGEKLASVLDHCPYVDEVVIFQRQHAKGRITRLIRLIRRLRRVGFDFSIDFQNNKWTHFLTWASGIPKRYGYRRGLLGGLLNEGVGNFQSVLPPVRHQFQVLNRVGIRDFDDRLELWVTEEEQDEIRERLAKMGVHSSRRPFIGFVVSASSRWNSKNWPLSRFVQLAEKLLKEREATIVLVGQEGDSPAFNALERLFPKRVVNFIGKTTVREMFALVKQLDCLVTPDSAPMHVAAALGVGLVPFFGPTDPERHLPPSGQFTLLRKAIPCAPCYREECTQARHRCMEDISIDEMYNAICRQLEKRESTPAYQSS